MIISVSYILNKMQYKNYYFMKFRKAFISINFDSILDANEKITVGFDVVFNFKGIEITLCVFGGG